MVAVSILIPTFRESDNLEAALRSASELLPSEIIICDGGSDDGTVEIAERFARQCPIPTLVIQSTRGRGTQLAAAARHAHGDVLLFLHADNRLDRTAIDQMAQAGWPAWGAFVQRIHDRRWRYRLLEWGNAWRVRCFARVFGDQALFVNHALYREVGGLDEVELMEDLMLSLKLRRIQWPHLLAGPVWVNARRWQRRGVVRQTWLNWRIQVAFAFGVSPQTLRKWYG